MGRALLLSVAAAAEGGGSLSSSANWDWFVLTNINPASTSAQGKFWNAFAMKFRMLFYDVWNAFPTCMNGLLLLSCVNGILGCFLVGIVFSYPLYSY
jgi:hypothetical protein